jgi:DNA ligase-1
LNTNGSDALRATELPFLLAQKADHPRVDYTGWWMSEKLDGVRAYWNGDSFLSRNGNRFDAPPSFTAHLPKDVTLDGELFLGRKQFQKAVGIVKSAASHPGWASLTYQVFDVPSMGAQPFEKRVETIVALLTRMPCKNIVAVEHRRASSKSEIASYFDSISSLGGEGIMLRQPGSVYAHTRSATLLKVKGTEEVDALVIGYDKGEGKNFGRVGALMVKLEDGKQFKVGSGLTDAQRDRPPPVGSIVVVRYQELTDCGVPRFPVFAGVRADGKWPPEK